MQSRSLSRIRTDRGSARSVAGVHGASSAIRTQCLMRTSKLRAPLQLRFQNLRLTRISARTAVQETGRRRCVTQRRQPDLTPERPCATGSAVRLPLRLICPAGSDCARCRGCLRAGDPRLRGHRSPAVAEIGPVDLVTHPVALAGCDPCRPCGPPGQREICKVAPTSRQMHPSGPVARRSVCSVRSVRHMAQKSNAAQVGTVKVARSTRTRCLRGLSSGRFSCTVTPLSPG
jgi:hypothetical protein